MSIAKLIFFFISASNMFWLNIWGPIKVSHLFIFTLAIRNNVDYKSTILFTIFAIFSSVYAVLRVDYTPHDMLQYKLAFWLVALGFWYVLYVALKASWFKVLGSKLTPSLIYTNIIIAFSLVALFSPGSIFSASDNWYGFFREKGVFGAYLAIMSCLLVPTLNTSLLPKLITFIIFTYVCFVIQSHRALLIYLVFGGWYLMSSPQKGRHALSFIVLGTVGFLGLGAIFSFETIGLFISKIDLLISSEGQVGRYAAINLLARLDVLDLLFGRGLGSYVIDRRELLPLLSGQLIDYPGSLIVQIIYEYGLIISILLCALFTSAVFGRFNVSNFALFILLGAVGGLQDTFQIFTTLCLSMFVQMSSCRMEKNAKR